MLSASSVARRLVVSFRDRPRVLASVRSGLSAHPCVSSRHLQDASAKRTTLTGQKVRMRGASLPRTSYTSDFLTPPRTHSVRLLLALQRSASSLQQFLFDTPTQNPLSEEFPGYVATGDLACSPFGCVGTENFSEVCKRALTVTSSDPSLVFAAFLHAPALALHPPLCKCPPYPTDSR